MESSGRQMLFPLAITLFDVVPPDKFNSFTNLIFNDVTLKHSIFVFFWRLGAERLVEPSLVSPLRSLLPRCPCDVWEQNCPNSLFKICSLHPVIFLELLTF